VFGALLGGFTVEGRRIYVWNSLEVGVNRDPDIDALFTGVDRFTVWSTPAAIPSVFTETFGEGF